LYPTTAQNFCILGYTAEDSFALWDTIEENCSGAGYNGKNFCFVRYNRRNFVMKPPEIVLWCIPHWRKTSSIVSHTEKKPIKVK
jgi:hypothetical protein